MGNSIYLLTGATGNLGSNIANTLTEKNMAVRALVRNPGKSRLDESVELVQGNLLDTDSLDEFFSVGEHTDIYVIHCAGKVSVNPGFDQSVHDVNIDGTRNIINKCIKHKVKKLVYVSSTGAIPEQPGNTPITEVDEFDPAAVTGYYSKSKAVATQLVLDSVNSNDLDASVVFPSGIMGPYDYGFGLITTAIIDFIKGKIPFALEGTFNCTDARDLSEGIFSCCIKGKKGEGYIMANGTVTMHELLGIIADVNGCRRVGLVIPARIAVIFAAAVELFGKITRRPVLFTRFTLYNLMRNNNFCSDKASRELGYKTRPFRETIRDEVLWLREEGHIK